MPDKNRNSNPSNTSGNDKTKNDGGKDDSKDRLDSLLDAGSGSTNN